MITSTALSWQSIDDDGVVSRSDPEAWVSQWKVKLAMERQMAGGCDGKCALDECICPVLDDTDCAEIGGESG